jgi:hypothetical protein
MSSYAGDCSDVIDALGGEFAREGLTQNINLIPQAESLAAGHRLINDRFFSA